MFNLVSPFTFHYLTFLFLTFPRLRFTTSLISIFFHIHLALFFDLLCHSLAWSSVFLWTLYIFHISSTVFYFQHFMPFPNNILHILAIFHTPACTQKCSSILPSIPPLPSHTHFLSLLLTPFPFPTLLHVSYHHHHHHHHHLLSPSLALTDFHSPSQLSLIPSLRSLPGFCVALFRLLLAPLQLREGTLRLPRHPHLLLHRFLGSLSSRYTSALLLKLLV